MGYVALFKGTLSEAELHSLRLRLDAGRLSKARRGELVQHLPTGYVRQADGSIAFDPDQSVRDRIHLVFRQFSELGSMQKVLRFLVRRHLPLPRRQTSGHFAGETLWKEPSINAVQAILKNPAYSGAYAYGRRSIDRSRQTPGRPASGRLRRPRDQWLALVPDVYPAYISWADFERNQTTIAENRQAMDERLRRTQALRSGSALLTGLVRCGLCGHSLSVHYKQRRFQYVCQSAKHRYGQPTCQHLAGLRIDAAVVAEFFAVLESAQIDALERVTVQHAQHHREMLKHLGQEVTRLEYAATRAERQYDRVDPDNRLIAATLEAKWERALAECEQAKSRLAECQAQIPQAVPIPTELRSVFANVGQRLPDLWPNLSEEARKKLLRTLVTGVNLRREPDGFVQVRIVWQGGQVCERRVRLPVSTRRRSEHEAKIVARIRELVAAGHRDDAIAQPLNREGAVPCRGDQFTPQIVLKLRGRFFILLGLERIRRGEQHGAYTIAALARRLKVDAAWIYRAIAAGRIRIKRNPLYGCFLFPRTRKTVQDLQRLRRGELPHIAFPEVHCNG
ncbi:hypothetical protein BH11PLA2_BH11PLA2_44610 [soil metagenome]